MSGTEPHAPRGTAGRGTNWDSGSLLNRVLGIQYLDPWRACMLRQLYLPLRGVWALTSSELPCVMEGLRR
jgi:hypothetical protein